MLSGKFVNCYGLRDFNLPEINFDDNNKAIIYAPNGVMKSSLSKVFEDISKGQTTSDRIFKSRKTSYSVNYYDTEYKNDSLSATECIYVVNSFSEKFELPKETMTTLLADEVTRKAYDDLIFEFSSEIKELESNISTQSGLTKPKIKDQLIVDLNLQSNADWPDIFLKLKELMVEIKDISVLQGIKHTKLFNEKTKEIFKNKEFLSSIEQYIDEFNKLVSDNTLLCNGFNDYNAEQLSASLEKHNIFKAEHSILLKDGHTQIKNIDEWKQQVKTQLEEIYSKPELSKTYNSLKKLLTKNAESLALREIIISNRSIIPYLFEPTKLCSQLWIHYMHTLDKNFVTYADKITSFSEQVKALYEKASAQAECWNDVVDEFNSRFKVPFKVYIANKANYLLKNEAPNLYFKYTSGKDTPDEMSANFVKEDLILTLSMGERRALYLLYILFDLERIKKRAIAGVVKYLIVIDDIADSFDYKNKYAIIEYLNDLTMITNIDLLVLTHNFDFYRTVMSRLCVSRKSCYIVQKNKDDLLSMSQFKYRNDFFRKVLVESIRDGNVNTDDKKKNFISSIPFYRNLFEYMLKDDEYSKLTCCLHVKSVPLNTNSIKLSDIWSFVQPYFGLDSFNISNDELYVDAIKRIANEIIAHSEDEVFLENKIMLSIAIRLLTEFFLEAVLIKNLHENFEQDRYQTRNWSKLAKPYLSKNQTKVIDDVNLMTPESIHLNSFMYEPIIDMSDWRLRDLYLDVFHLGEQ